MTARRPMPTPRRRRWPAMTTSIGSPAASQGRRARRPRALLSAHPSRLSDRRGGRSVRQAARRRRQGRRMSGTLEKAVTEAARGCHRTPRRSRCGRCCRRPAPPSTSTTTSKSAATTSAQIVVDDLAAKEGRHDRLCPHRSSAWSAQWWWTVDRWTLAAIIALMFIGAILVLAASPAVATRIGLDSFALVRHHYMMLPAGAGRGGDRISVLSPQAGAPPRRRPVLRVPGADRADARLPAWRSRAPRAGSRSGRSRCSPPNS